MKPTKEIIELAKRLKELDYRDDLHVGNWVAMEGNVLLITSREGYTFRLDGEDYYRKVTRQYFNSHDTNFLIPSLENGLAWLTHEAFVKFKLSNADIGYRCIIEKWRTGNLEWKREFYAGTPHEAVLKAVVKVLENK